MTGQQANTAPAATESNWKVPHGNRDDQADDQSRERSLPRRPARPAEQHQHDDDRQGRDEERWKQGVADRGE
jgi:hypothetical protein